jgi:hypothetical protein
MGDMSPESLEGLQKGYSKEKENLNKERPSCRDSYRKTEFIEIRNRGIVVQREESQKESDFSKLTLFLEEEKGKEKMKVRKRPEAS